MATKTIVCDLCGKGGKQKCYGCDKDLCDQCATQIIYTDQFLDNGDYPQHLCPKCLRLFRDIEGDVQRMHDLFDTEIERLKTEWKKKCGGE